MSIYKGVQPREGPRYAPTGVQQSRSVSTLSLISVSYLISSTAPDLESQIRKYKERYC